MPQFALALIGCLTLAGCIEPFEGSHVQFTLAGVPPPERFGYEESVGVLLAALVVLQTHVRIHRGPDGKWTVLLEKKASKDGLLKPLVQKLLALVSSPRLKP